MKTNETRAASQPQGVAETADPRKRGAFSKILERKGAEEKPAQPLLEAPLQPLLRLNDAAGEAAPVRAAVTVRDLDGLAQEIAVTVRGADLREVQIQMDSKTMDGLQIRISKENGKLNVRMQANSAEVSRLLAQQSDALVQRLEARGYQGAVVQVQSTPASASGDARSRQRSRQGSGEHRDSREGQGRRQ
jgi:type III secretion system needle length determinant